MLFRSGPERQIEVADKEQQKRCTKVGDVRRDARALNTPKSHELDGDLRSRDRERCRTNLGTGDPIHLGDRVVPSPGARLGGASGFSTEQRPVERKGAVEVVNEVQIRAGREDGTRLGRRGADA